MPVYCDPGRFAVDLAVMLADGGEAISDLGVLREQAALFGPVVSDPTAARQPITESVRDRCPVEKRIASAHATSSSCAATKTPGAGTPRAHMHHCVNRGGPSVEPRTRACA